MGDQRVDNALTALVEILVPSLNDEDAASYDERRDDALTLARDILDTSVVIQSSQACRLTCPKPPETLRRSPCQPCCGPDQTKA